MTNRILLPESELPTHWYNAIADLPSPPPESTHAIAATIREAQRCKETGEAKTLLFCLSGHGHFDMAAYESYLAGDLEDFEYPREAIAQSLESLPKIA